jgi:hypothetical protein
MSSLAGEHKKWSAGLGSKSSKPVGATISLRQLRRAKRQ